MTAIVNNFLAHLEADDGEGHRIACVQFSSRLNDLLQRVNVRIGTAAWRTVVVILISFRKEWKRIAKNVASRPEE